MLVPSIWLKGGKVVYLQDGRKIVLTHEDVLGLAQRLGRVGEIAIVDLDAALGTGDNEMLVKTICQTARCRVVGGIRSEDKARRLLRAGAWRIVVGKAASREFLSRLPRHRVIAAINVRPNEEAGQDLGPKPTKQAVEEMQVLAPYVSGFLCVTGEWDGNKALSYEEALQLRKATTLPLTMDGGACSIEDIARLDKIGFDLQVGGPEYWTSARLAEAFVACLDFSRGPLPTIVQDKAGQVITLAYSNPQSLMETIVKGKVCFSSPGPSGALESSLIRVEANCTREALLFSVKQEGPACARQTYSCFGSGDRLFDLRYLFDVILSRKREPRLGSYTSFLFEKEDRIPRKLNEEVYELLTAKTHEDVVWEAADVLYFLLTYLAKHDVTLDEVIAELRGRER